MKKYTVELDYEIIEPIMQNVLINDYHMVCENIRSINMMPDVDVEMKNDNLEYFVKWRDALKVMLEYYLPIDQCDKIINT